MQTGRPREDTLERLLVTIVAGLFVVRGLGHLSFVPIWDGRIYADCIGAAAKALDPSMLNCAGHPSIGYTALLALAQLAAPERFAPLLVANLLLGAAALIGFHEYLRILEPAPANRMARLAATAVLSVHPVLLASAVSISPDYGLTIFFVLTLWASAARRYWAAGLLGTALALSKEPGIGLYVLAVGGHAAILGEGPLPRRLRTMLRPPLLLPFLGLGAFLAGRLSSGTLWGGQSLGDVGAAVISPGFGLIQRFFLVWIFVAGFQWVGTLAILAGWVYGLLRRPRVRPTAAMTCVCALLLLGAYGLTRFATFGNPRYFLALAPLLVAAAYLSVVGVPWKRGWATGLLAVWATLFALASIRTADPVMRALYGTFPFGKHEMLITTSRTGECCGFGRDQLVYNLEFVRFHELQDTAYVDRADDPAVVLSAHPLTDWYFAGPVGADHRRTLGPGTPIVLTPPAAILSSARLPARIRYLAFPNFPNGRQVSALLTKYDLVGRRRYEADGYLLEALDLALRDPP